MKTTDSEKLPDSVTVTVNYDRSLAQAFKAAKCEMYFMWHNPSIIRCPERKGKVQRTVFFRSFPCKFRSKKRLVAELDRQGFKFDPWAAAAVAEKFPKLQNTHRYTCFGEGKDGKYYSMTWCGIGGRNMDFLDNGSESFCGITKYFAIVKKEEK